MKRLNLFALVLALLVASTTLKAQEAVLATGKSGGPVKIGYTSVLYVLSLSPKAKEIDSELRARSAQLEKELTKKRSDFEEKAGAFQRGQNTMSETIKADRIKELRDLESSIMEFSKNAEAELQNKKEELYTPELEKINKAIRDVAKENSYTFILNGDPQIMIYGEEEYEVTDLVLKKLGITRPAPGSSTPSPGTTTEQNKTAPAKPAGSPVRTVPKKK